MNILVIGAHPDDEVLGLGGTLLKHVDNGDNVYCHLLTNGESSRSVNNQKGAIANRINAAMEVAKIMGFMDIFFDEFSDQALDTLPITQIVKSIESYSNKINPDVVYFHHGGDLNFDHQIVYQAAITAFRPVGNYPHTLLSYSTPSSTEWGGIHKSFVPNYFVDITEYFDRKIRAIECYKMELRDFPHPRSVEMIKADALKQGSVVAKTMAEAFMLIRKVG
ncbi:MAG TPA: PIG-L family deacetylase [Fulvivirga sp.]|nr:PIG-L family deacetylase [Fulvivirga sp.]